MSKPKLVVLSLALAGGLFAATYSPATSATQFPTPHANHKRIQQDVGMWEGEFEMFMPGMPQGMKGKVTENVQSFGPFWTVSSMEGNVMGMPFEGRYQLGYDPDAKEYKGTWIDTMAPLMSVMTGSFDEDSNTLTMRYRGPDQTGRETDQWNTSRVAKDGKRHFAAFMKTADGKDFQTMSIVYTRKAEETEEGSR